MTKTLLEITQYILSVMDGDEVNSINDTEEAEQVAGIVRQTYRNIVSESVWPHTRRAVALTPRSDSNLPTHMVLNDNVKELISILYNTAKVGDTRRTYKKVEYLDPDDFLRKTNSRNNDNDDVDIVVDDSGIELLIMNDKAPQYFTSFDDTNVVFDSYDSAADATLQASKLQAQAYIIPEFLLEDSFVADLPPDAFSLLQEESLSKAQATLRQFQDVKAEQESTRQRRWMSRKSWRTSGGIRYPNYGRKR